MKNNKKSKSFNCDTKTNNLSTANLEVPIKCKLTKKEIEETNEKVYEAINKIELKKALETYLKQQNQYKQTEMRDFGILKSIISEYLDSFIVFGYNLHGERVIIQNYPRSKDRDAIMEFLKIIFFKQQQDNFLDD
jgi:hypothetical protein